MIRGIYSLGSNYKNKGCKYVLCDCEKNGFNYFLKTNVEHIPVLNSYKQGSEIS